jgi:uncharacterized damage-inducible protein DinB
MVRDRILLDEFYEKWKQYQDNLKQTIAGLSADQLTFRAHPNQRSLGVIISHIIAGRVYWFHGFLGEGSGDIRSYQTWDDEGQPARSADELVHGLDVTWDFMQQYFDRWTPDDLVSPTYPDMQNGKHYDRTRTWVIFRVLQHDLLHSGEAAILLGMQGIDAPEME